MTVGGWVKRIGLSSINLEYEHIFVNHFLQTRKHSKAKYDILIDTYFCSCKDSRVSQNFRFVVY